MPGPASCRLASASGPCGCPPLGLIMGPQVPGRILLDQFLSLHVLQLLISCRDLVWCQVLQLAFNSHRVELVDDMMRWLQLVCQLKVPIHRLQLSPTCLPLHRWQLPGLRPVCLLGPLQAATELSCHDRVGLMVELPQLREVCMVSCPSQRPRHLLDECLIIS